MRQFLGRVRADARVIVHVQHPDVVPGLPLREAERVGVVVGTGLEPGAVRRLVVAWDRDNSNRWTRQPHDLITRLTGLLDDHVDAQVQEERGSSRQNDRTTRSSAGYVSRRPIVGTTTTSISCTTGCGGGRGWRCIRRAVRRPPASPIADVRTGSVQTTEVYQSSELEARLAVPRPQADREVCNVHQHERHETGHPAFIRPPDVNGPPARGRLVLRPHLAPCSRRCVHGRPTQ